VDLFALGFIVSLVSTWLAVGVGVLLLLLPGKPRGMQASASVDRQRAA